MFTSIKVKAPSTTANLGSSFDFLGLALNLHNNITISMNVVDEFFYNGKPQEVNCNTNLIFKVISRFFEINNTKRPSLKVEVENEIPLSRGLGSSSAAIASTLVAVNSLCFDDKFSFDELLNISLFFEPHPDNLAASFFGGLVASAILDSQAKKVSYFKFPDVTEFYEPKSLLFFVPNYHVNTNNSRVELFNNDQNFSHLDYLSGLNKAILNMISFAKGEFSNLFFSMKDDVWHQKIRTKNIRFFYEIDEIARQNNVDGVALSGSGPTILLVVEKQKLEVLKKFILEIDGILELNPEFYELKPTNEGVQILWKK